MKIHTDAKITQLQSWDRDHTEYLTIVRGPSETAMFLVAAFGPSVSVLLTKEESAQLAADVARLLGPLYGVVKYSERDEAATERTDAHSVQIRVFVTTMGEPYQEGIAIDLSPPRRPSLFNFEMDRYTARELCKALG